EKAEDQLNYLEPLLNVVRRHHDQQGRIAHTKQKIDAVEIYISAIQKDFLETQIAQLQAQIHEAERAFQETINTLETLTQQRRELERDIDKNDMGQRLQRLESSLNDLQQELNKRQQQQQKYHKSAIGVNLSVPQSIGEFDENRDIAQTELDKIQTQLDDLDEKRIRIGVDISELKHKGRDIEDEIKSLRQRKNQIPKHDIEIRERLLHALQSDGMAVSDADFPFAGELLKVREDYEAWEPAIQRLLGGFGRQLLVPKKYYFAVSEFVEQTNLKGRLVYHQVRDTQPVSEDHLPQNNLYHRLQIKTDTGFTEWLREKIINSYNYVCADDLSQFRRATRAITIKGQVKHGRERHEKDDRYSLGDRSRYVLGWENEAKIRLLEVQRNELGEQFHQLAQRENKIKATKAELSTRQNNYQRLLHFDTFNTLDTVSVSTDLNTISQELETLKAQVAQSQLAHLRQQLNETKQKITDTDNEKTQHTLEIGGLKRELTTHTSRLKRIEHILNPIELEAFNEILNQIHEELLEIFGEEPSLDNSEQAERQLRTHYNNQLDGQNTRLRAMQTDAIKLMQDFKAAYRTETQDVDASLESSAITWYEEKYQQIHHHDLPRYKSDFEELVRKKITDSITSFRSGMLNQVTEYRKRIDQLNESLKQISYTSETYIQLVYEDTTDQQIRAFNSQLINCFPNASIHGDDANKQAYLNVRELIERLDTETYWAKKVTDVRNWLDFAADERHKSDDSQQERYEGASGKSGGQKAKLAYTIMASAIAYQYGIFATRRDPSKTFRFVVVDEVFSKSDESNSRFAMDLFRQLGLQVLVVTPSDKIHIVEPYIGICHWVKNNDEGNDSRVADITIEQLQQTREQVGAAD
ncbi:MAG: SbcC/MukB-like Walker B domain-containing protein, partial [Chloroflexota bacterium]